MDRLTKRTENSTAVYNTASGNPVKWGNNRHKVLQKLAEYEDLEEQGKLLKLPCVVGDTVYVLRIDNAAYMMSNKKVWEIVEERFEVRHFDCIGKTVFLTREEAKAALEELVSDNAQD